MQIEPYFDEATASLSYLLIDSASGRCAIIDSVLDYDPRTGRTRHDAADQLIERIRRDALILEWLLETHVHADHLSAAAYLKTALGGQSVIGSQVGQVQAHFARVFNAGDDFARDGSQFDRLLADGESLALGSLRIRALHTPGHTPACVSYRVTHAQDEVVAVFVGDTLFAPDYGTARCDFPGGDAATLYRSIARLLSLPAATPLYLCHDYRPNGRPMRHVTTVAEQRAANIHLPADGDEAAFVRLRRARDATLDAPVLLLPAVQVNMRAGNFPAPECNGIRYLKIPVDVL